MGQERKATAAPGDSRSVPAVKRGKVGPAGIENVADV